MTSKQATQVVIRAPTAMGQKSLGVPIQVRGVRQAATITIHMQRDRSNPAAATMDPSNWAIKTMNTQPPPYKVREIATSEAILKRNVVKIRQ